MANRNILIFLAIGLFVLLNGVKLQDSSPPSIQNEFPSKCLGDLGCFSTDVPYFHPVFRPLSVLPFDLKHIKTKFWLFGPDDTEEGKLLEPEYESVERSNFNPYLETKVIIHGFANEISEKGGFYILKNVLLGCKDYNVIIVNWTDSSTPPYPQAFANARVVSAQLAKLINFLKDYMGVAPESVHLIGHSLGAHLAGWAGERIPNLGRITGLDPIGAYFYKAEPSVRLDYTDAIFVDVIHTNGANYFLDGYGLEEAIGHLDFYPNGGRHQPGCEPPSNMSESEALDYKNSCSQLRALRLFINSVFSDRCRFEGVACASAEDFASGKCQSSQRWRSVMPVTFEMGHHGRKPPFVQPGRKYYLNTVSDLPICNTTGEPQNC